VADKKSTKSSKSVVAEVLQMPSAPMKKKSSRKLKPGKRVKPHFKRVPPRIIQKAKPAAKPVQVQPAEIDNSQAAAFAASLAMELKQSDRRQVVQDKADDGVKLSRRPTTRTQGKATEKFPENDLRDFRRRLLEARERAMNGVDAMKATGFNESDDHEADGGDGTNLTLRLQALSQMGSINRIVQQIDEALHRIDDGTYGVCTICGQLIRKPRLINQPFVLTCMECQNEIERGSRR